MDKLYEIKGPYNAEMMELLEFSLSKLNIPEKINVEIFSSKYVPKSKHKAHYDPCHKKISIAVDTISFSVLSAIAHELMHADQDFNGRLPKIRHNDYRSEHEIEASKFAAQTLREFEKYQKQKGTYIERPILHRYEF